MTRRNFPRGLLSAKARSCDLTVATAAALGLASGHVAAQTTPYQSAQRGAYGSGIGQSDLPKGGRFEPRLEAALQYADNLDLAQDGAEQVDTFGLEAAPGFYAAYSSGNALAAIDYSLVGRAWEDSDYNDVSHRLSANGEWSAVPEWFSLSGQASYDTSILDPRRSLNYGNIGIFGSSNLQEIATASVMPMLSHQFGDLQVVARYQYGRTWYLDEGLGTDAPVIGFVSDQDSEDQSAGVSLGTASDAGSNLSGTVYYDWNASDYETAVPYEYEKAGVDAGLRFARTLTLLGEYGKESDLDASTTQGGLDSEFWNAGLRWEPNDRTSAEGRYGERFFGSSWSLDVTHRARLLEFNAVYSEEPTVETRQLSLGSYDPGTLPPPGVPDFDFGRANNSPYVARDASASVRAVGTRTTLALTAFQFERDYISDVRQDETNLGASFGITRDIASNLSADFNIGYSDYEHTTSGLVAGEEVTSNEKDTTVGLRLNRETGETLTLSAEAGYLVRSGDTGYEGWWTAIRARWTP